MCSYNVLPDHASTVVPTCPVVVEEPKQNTKHCSCGWTAPMWFSAVACFSLAGVALRNTGGLSMISSVVAERCTQPRKYKCDGGCKVGSRCSHALDVDAEKDTPARWCRCRRCRSRSEVGGNATVDSVRWGVVVPAHQKNFRTLPVCEAILMESLVAEIPGVVCMVGRR